ncbi:MAG: putative phage tail assembly chaperone [Azospira sp.]|jgi:hypothetical protein|nr:putative phage tail assembly chaperone [Azospira sp.]
MDNTKQIGERTYSFGTLPPVEAVRVEVAVARVIGEPLFKAFMDAKKTGSTEKDAEQAGATAIGLLLSKMDADELLATMETVFKYVTCDGKRVEINATFSGRNKELWQVFIAALRFNFSDFLPAGLFASVQSAVTK